MGRKSEKSMRDHGEGSEKTAGEETRAQGVHGTSVSRAWGNRVGAGWVGG